MKIRRSSIKDIISGFVFLSPFFIVYLFLFWLANETARDRGIYIGHIMANPFSGREELGLHFISYLLGFVIESPKLKLFFVQVSFVALLILTLSKSFQGNTFNGLAKSLVAFVIIIAAFSNQLGVQLRIGYASILFCFIYFFLELKPNLKNLVFYLLPCLMHTALIPAVAMLYFFYVFKVSTLRQYLPLLFIALCFSLFVVPYMEALFSLAGVPGYYYQYLLGGELVDGRKVPFSMLFYLLLLSFMFLRRGKYKHEVPFWFCFSGLLLVLPGFSGFYIAFKMLVPITLFLLIQYFRTVNFNRPTSVSLMALFVFVFPVSSYYYSLQVGLL